MVTCAEADLYLDAVAGGGDDVPPDTAAHLAACSRCQVALANARLIDAALRTLPAADVPALFTNAVMTKVRRQRWRSEQIIDWTFNVALALGLVLIAGGIAGVAWASGMVAIGGDMLTLARTGADQIAEHLAGNAATFAVAGVLLITTLGLWWWAEADLTI